MAKPVKLKDLLRRHLKPVLNLPWKEVKRYGRIGFNIAHAMSENLPSKNEGFVKMGAAVLATVDEVNGVLFPTTSNPKAQFLASRNLTEYDNSPFIDLFFDTDFKKDFLLTDFRITDWELVTEARHPKLGTLYFFKSTYAEKYESRFYVSRGGDLSTMLADIWGIYEGRIHVAVVPGMFCTTKTTFTHFSAGNNPLHGVASEKMDTLVLKHRRYMINGKFRSYMFFGQSGTGKSTFACAMADRLGERILKMDATSLAHASYQDIAFLLNTLKPDFVLIDDIDKADVNRVIPTLLDIIARFKGGEEKATLMMTSNTVDKFDPGLLRPGRVDTWLEFPVPDETERRQVLKMFGVPDNFLDILVLETEGLTQDYLREAAETLDLFHLDEVLDNLRRMRKLLGKVEDAKVEKEKSNGVKETAPPLKAVS